MHLEQVSIQATQWHCLNSSVFEMTHIYDSRKERHVNVFQE